MFNPVPSKVDFPALERDTLAWWHANGTIQKYLQRNNNSSKRFSFIDGPITANNPMGVHHAWGRTYKDLFQRYKTMQGFKQRYQNGFDGQGLWIEVEVEKELGFSSKRDIEEYGIARFVDLCKQRVQRFSTIQTDQSIRLGYWMDWENSYHTMSDENNYTIWHFLKVCHERGWLYEGTDVMPWCPRCGTGLSEHEIVTEGYREIVHPGVFVRFPLNDRDHESLLVWTTTPWTLPSNVAAAVHPELTYVKVSDGTEALYLAKGRLSSLQGDYKVVEELLGRDLEGLKYSGPFDELPVQMGVEHQVIIWNEVTEQEGTGIVHIAPGAGKEDFALGKDYGLPVIASLDDSGIFVIGFDWLTGKSVSEVNPAIFKDLGEKGVLYHVEDYLHRYPVCWRCQTELVFRLVTEWFISMDELRHLITNVTLRTHWIPEFGLKRELDWLQNMDDWMISKKRYWGLALPIYKCESCGYYEVIGSEVELKQRAIEGWEFFEGHSPHRPWIDSVKIRCQQCGCTVPRITDVGNPWLDAGIVPFSTLGYRHDRSYWEEWFPADWISESFPGQFRNWFYSLLTMSTVLENQEPFRYVFSYALMRDGAGEEMHKSRGNAIWFDDAAEEIGVDTMRWLFARHNPANNLNFGQNTTDEIRRRFFLTLWNIYSFFVTYANIDGYDPMTTHQIEPTSELDRWILSELNILITRMTKYMDDYNAASAAECLENFVDELSNWYVRRSRRRFWKSESDTDKSCAYSTLYQCLTTLTHLLAPFTPFIAEAMYQNLVRSVEHTAPESVHLTDWPEPNLSLMDEDLSSATQLAMKVASLGRSARNQARIKVRQPLNKALVYAKTREEAQYLPRIADQILDELNVKHLSTIEDEDQVLEFHVRLNLAVAGPKYGQAAQHLDELVRNSPLAMNSGTSIVHRIRAGLPVDVGGKQLEPEDFIVESIEKPGYKVAQEAGYLVALETTITPELRDEGFAREMVHRIQNMRRSAGFDIADRIALWVQGSGRTGQVIERFGGYIMEETLTDEFSQGSFEAGVITDAMKIEGEEVLLGIMKKAGYR